VRPDVIKLAELRESPLSVAEVTEAVMDPAAGGIAVFAGVVRDNDHGEAVTALSYSAHPTAVAELRKVAEHVAATFDAHAIAAVHRVGDLAIGDLAVVVAVSTGHRAEAFAACRMLIDDLKASVPIWKHQHFASGVSEWVLPGGDEQPSATGEPRGEERPGGVPVTA
jgi:molybdopterin synthase catalytic subunit